MKIGLLTFHGSSNPGAFWQAYATCQLLQRLGHEPEIIDYYSPFRHRRSHWYSATQLTSWKRPDLLAKVIGQRIVAARTQKMLPISSTPILTSDKLKQHYYDAIIIGSDVVWESPIDPVYLGKHLNTDRLIAYAASAGGAVAESTVVPPEMQGESPFHAISVRDKNTIRLLERTGWDKDVALVNDPTITLEIPEDCFARPRAESYIMIYMSTRPSPPMLSAIRSYARKRKLKVYAVFYTQRWADRNFPFVTAQRWMQFLYNADAVITNTFHGSILSRFNNRPLAIAEMSSVTALKSLDQFTTLGIVNRIVNDPAELSATVSKAYAPNNGVTQDKLAKFNEAFLKKNLTFN